MSASNKSSVTFGAKDDSFNLGELIDQGSQAEVYYCTRKLTGQTHAVKRIDLGSLRNRRNATQARRNLTREIKITRELNHEHIVNLIEAFWEGDICFIVMDLARGGTLHDKLKPGSGLDDEGTSSLITYQLLEGMGYMHSHKVIHRDLKPANVLMKSDKPRKPYGTNFVKIADFGLSRAMNEPGGEVRDMSKVGTPAFAAPEVLTGHYSFEADYWSLGCIVFTMLCGEYPFDEMPEHIRNPKTGKVKISHCKAWTAASDDARAFVLALLCVQPTDRHDLHGCLQHKWMKECVDNITQYNFKSFRAQQQTSAGELVVPRTNSKDDCCWPCSLLQQRGAGASARPRASIGASTVPVQGVIQSINGWSGHSVDSVELTYTDGDVKRHGGQGGTEPKNYSLRPDEAIFGVTQERVGDGYLGNALVFFTSKGRTLAIKGSDAATKHRFVAAAGCEIVGLQFEDSQLIGILMRELKPGAVGSVASIWGSEGHCVDAISMQLRDGNEYYYGGEGGDQTRKYTLKASEYIVIAEQGFKDAYLGYSLSFYTSEGNVYSFRGVSATQSLRFMATGGRQLYGLEFEEGRLARVTTVPLSGDVQMVTPHSLLKETHVAGEKNPGNPRSESTPISPSGGYTNGRA